MAAVDDKILSWAADDRWSGAYQQARGTAGVPGVEGVRVMPDAHYGRGACIGTVVATDGTIIPAAVGVDLGCGMSAAMVDMTADQLPDSLEGVLDLFSKAVPHMEHQGHREASEERKEALKWLKRNKAPSGRADMGRAANQMGTLGGGNHFLELSVDTSDRVWVVLHSGSRGVGNYLATQHINIAKAIDRKGNRGDLSVFVEGTAEFDEYIADMLWAQDYAAKNRKVMLANAVSAFLVAVGRDGTEPGRAVCDVIMCHHNYAERETHDGRDLWITRKGAIRAEAGDRGIIPGSMGTATYLVEGLGNNSSYNSAAHGAGRVMSRRKAKETYTVDDLTADMTGKVWLESKAARLVDETPGAYKDIEAVMAAQQDLCVAVDRLESLVNYKGV